MVLVKANVRLSRSKESYSSTVLTDAGARMTLPVSSIIRVGRL